MKLAEFIAGRDNNFNLIRIIAAYAVLVSHSFPLALGRGTVEPPLTLLGMSFGSMAVDIFFLASGFLVTGSLLARKNTLQFLWARALRIYPALFFMLVITVGTLGIFFTTLPASEFFSHPITQKYFVRCLTLVNSIKFELPGVFMENPYAKSVNGSLWTMRYEVRLYIIIGLLWALLHLAGQHQLRAFKILVITSALIFGLLFFAGRFNLIANQDALFRFGFLFMSGGSYFILRERITLSGRIALPLFLILVISAAIGHDAFFVAYSLGLGYLLLYAAYVPTGFIRHYNRFGDYSYGIYIYAFPVQQAVAALVPGITVLEMIALSSLITLTFAVLSWHLVEERALGFKDVFLKKPALQGAATR